MAVQLLLRNIFFNKGRHQLDCVSLVSNRVEIVGRARLGFQESPDFNVGSRAPVCDKDVTNFGAGSLEQSDNTVPKYFECRLPTDTLPLEPPPSIPLPIPPARAKRKFTRYLVPKGLSSTKALAVSSTSQKQDPSRDVIELKTFK